MKFWRTERKENTASELQNNDFGADGERLGQKEYAFSEMWLGSMYFWHEQIPEERTCTREHPVHAL